MRLLRCLPPTACCVKLLPATVPREAQLKAKGSLLNKDLSACKRQPLWAMMRALLPSHGGTHQCQGASACAGHALHNALRWGQPPWAASHGDIAGDAAYCA